MSFLSQLRNAYKITYLPNPRKNALNFWELFCKRCYGSKPLGNSKFFNRKNRKRIKRVVDKYKHGIILKRRYDRTPSIRDDEPFQEPHSESSTNMGKGSQYKVYTNNYPELKLNDEMALLSPKKPLIWTAFKQKNKFPVMIYKKRCKWDNKPMNIEEQNPVLSTMVARYKHDDSGADGRGENKFDPSNPFYTETITRSTMKGPSGLNYWVRKKKNAKASAPKAGQEDKSKPKPTSYVSLTTKRNGRDNETNIFDLPLKLANELKKIHVSGMKLNFEMDMNIKEALLNQNKPPDFEQQKLDDPKVALSTKVKLDPNSTQTVALPFDAMIHGIVDVNPQGLSKDKLRNLKVNEFNEYVATIAANLCSTALQKSFSTEENLSDRNEPDEGQEDTHKPPEDYEDVKILSKDPNYSEKAFSNDALIKLFERYDEAKAQHFSERQAVNDHATALGLTSISVSDTLASKKRRSPHIVCVREGDRGCTSPGLADNKPFIPRGEEEISTSSTTFMTSIIPKVGKFHLDLLDCRVYKESLKEAEARRREMKTAKWSKKRSPSSSSCKKKSSSSSKWGAAKKRTPSAAKCGGPKRRVPSASKCTTPRKRSPSASKCAKPRNKNSCKRSPSASKCGGSKR